MNPGGVVKVGVIWMAREEILENVMREINGVVENLPRKWTGKSVPSTLDIKQQNMFYNTRRQSSNSKQKSIKFDGNRPKPRSNKIDR